MILKRLKAWLTLCVLSAGVLSAQQSLSLREAQEYAVKHAFGMQSVKADAEAAKLQTDELIGIGLPQVNASLQYNNYIDLPTSLVPAQFFGGQEGEFARVRFGTPQNMTVGVTVSQLLFDGSWLVGLEASKAYAALQQKQVAKTEADLRLEVHQSYNLALAAADNAALLNQSREVLANLLKETKALWEAGFTEEQSVQQLELSLNDLDNKVAYARQQEQLTLDLLKFRIGMPLTTVLSLSDNTQTLLSGAAGSSLSQSFNPDSQLDVQLVKSGLGMQQLNLKNKKATLLPSAGAFYNLQTQAQRNEFNFFDTAEPWFPIQLWGVQISAPIFTGMRRSKGIQKARVEVQRMTDMLIMTREAVQLEYNNAKAEHEYALKNFDTSKRNLELANDIMRKTGVKFKEGLAGSFELSQASNQVLSAQGGVVQATLALLNASAKLNKLLNIP